MLKSKADASAHSANELESKLVWATQRSSDLESELVTLREEAKLSLDVKVKEVVAATQAARDALLGKSAAETEIQQLKQRLDIQKTESPKKARLAQQEASSSKQAEAGKGIDGTGSPCI